MSITGIAGCPFLSLSFSRSLSLCLLPTCPCKSKATIFNADWQAKRTNKVSRMKWKRKQSKNEHEEGRQKEGTWGGWRHRGVILVCYIKICMHVLYVDVSAHAQAGHRQIRTYIFTYVLCILYALLGAAKAGMKEWGALFVCETWRTWQISIAWILICCPTHTHAVYVEYLHN